MRISEKRHYVAKESIRSIAKHHGVHRRMVRQALADARPVKRQVSRYPAKVITEAVKAVIRNWLKTDKEDGRCIATRIRFAVRSFRATSKNTR